MASSMQVADVCREEQPSIIRMPSVVLPIASTSTALSSVMSPPSTSATVFPAMSPSQRLLRYHRSTQQQKTLNDIIIKRALQAYDQTIDEKRKMETTCPEPEFPDSMNSEQRKRRGNYIYMKQRVESRPVVPMPKKWFDSMLSLVPRALKEGAQQQAVVQELFVEISRDFVKSMKRYMVKSVLRIPDVTGLESEDLEPLPESPLGLDFSNPWHDTFVKARKDIGANLHLLHPHVRAILELGFETFSDLLVVDLSEQR